jgi:Tfp pilus assembly protein PilE
MARLNDNRRGFTLVEIILVTFTLIVIGVAGYFVAKHNDKTTASPTSVSPAVLDVSAVTNFVRNFYNQYNACVASGNINQTCTDNLVTENGTSKLLAYVNPSTGYQYAEDPIECAQEPPTTFSVSGVTSTPDSASGKVIETFGTSTSTETISFAVVSQPRAFKLTTVRCDPALSPPTQAP